MVHRAAPFPTDEIFRIDALEQLGLLDSVPELAYDDVVLLANTICGTPIGLISLVDRERQWFKACIGLDVQETHRDYAFCAHAILQPDELMVVEDATLDPRFSESPLVLGAPFIRFYAGAPIVTDEGYAIGTVCVIDVVPRQLSMVQRNALKALARQTAGLLHLRRVSLEQSEQTRELGRKITEALAAEDSLHAGLRQDRRVAAIGQLTSGVAHDFNNLLQAISFGLQLVQRQAGNPVEVRRHAENGLKAVTRGAELIAQLLTFSREAPPDLGALCAASHVRQMQELLVRVLGPEMHLKFELEGDGALVTCNSTQLEAALLNLVINARDAMNNVGNIRVSTCLREIRDDAELGDGLYFVLEVDDSGPGMPETVLKRVFEPFFTTKQAGKGTGLGLAQVYGFAARTGGVARIRSTPGQGTCVTLLLRATRDGVAPGSVDAATQQAENPQASGARILLVDDDDTIRELLQALLVANGYSVSAVPTGFAAIEKLQHEKPDLVLTDCAMRGLSGPTLARVLTEILPDVPVIFMSGYADTEELRQQFGADSVLLQKPIPVEKLIRQIERMLAAHAARPAPT